MTALPTRKLEAYRYADIAALGDVWDALAAPEMLHIAAGESVQQIWLPTHDDTQIRRAQITLAAGASAHIYALNSAVRYGRYEIDVSLEDGAHFGLNAAIIGGGSATLEIITTVRHIGVGGTSRQVIRNILGGTATGSYLGKVAVARGAQQTDSEQSVKAMLLGRGATANAKPELEIYADDVKCAHGATVGELDREQLFYAAARGMDPATARALLLEGFIGGLWDGLDDPAIRDAASTALRAIA
ncbi:SufD family Fe-S cluster assembly protein [Sphingomonas sp.]|uniref:SufD family Fe-S cluster assembly protein n=1 Tax=Sphingomonas sp. TaxID=28214 RepID=UPI00286CBCD4|nr:SufD family Fe-S cluster assembly protein [Sphingomonas sp.]